MHWQYHLCRDWILKSNKIENGRTVNRFLSLGADWSMLDPFFRWSEWRLLYTQHLLNELIWLRLLHESFNLEVSLLAVAHLSVSYLFSPFDAPFDKPTSCGCYDAWKTVMIWCIIPQICLTNQDQWIQRGLGILKSADSFERHRRGGLVNAINVSV